ncbi:MAG: biotin/lipoyl-binding protein, partial [Pseudohongiella sp.]
MSTPLFRPEVFAAQQGSGFGQAVFYQPLSVKLMVLVMLVLFACFVAFAASANIKQTERVRGYLTSAGGEVKIYGSRTGVLAEVLVSEGEFVEAGTVLAVATDAQFDHQGQQAMAAVMQQIDIQLQQLARRKTVLASRFEAQEKKIRQQLVGLRDALNLLKQEQQILLRRVVLAEQDYNASQQLLAVKTISEHEHRQVSSALYLLQQQATAGELAIARHLQTIEQAEQQLAQQP